jgi:hypothetical protein
MEVAKAGGYRARWRVIEVGVEQGGRYGASRGNVET